MIQLEAVGNTLIVEADKVEDTWKAGDVELYKPQQVVAQEQGGIYKGVVLSTGFACWDDFEGPDWAKIGDRVMWPRYAGHRVDVGDDSKWIFLLKDKDILCKYREVNDG